MFTDASSRHELGIARAELALRLGERDYAKELLDNAEIRAVMDGIVIFPDKRELIGKPAVVGERLMEIADADRVEVRVALPVADAIVLKQGARTDLFLDSEPLSSRRARIARSDYKARPSDGDILSIGVTAKFEDESRPLPRLGVRGTAKIYGESVSLGLYLLRRPLSALRQWVGL